MANQWPLLVDLHGHNLGSIMKELGTEISISLTISKVSLKNVLSGPFSIFLITPINLA